MNFERDREDFVCRKKVEFKVSFHREPLFIVTAGEVVSSSPEGNIIESDAHLNLKYSNYSKY